MVFLTSSVALDMVGVLFLLILLVYRHYTRFFNYWRNKNVPHLKPKFLFGNTKDLVLFRTSQGEGFQQVYRQLKGQKFGGFFDSFKPVLMLRDPEVIKQVLVRDFWHFPDRGMFFDEKRDPLTGHLFNMEGQRWRNLRQKLTPTFTSGKMKAMFPLVRESGKRLLDGLHRILQKGQEKSTVDVKELCAQFTTDVIGSCAFGLNAGAIEDPNSEFRRIGRLLLVPPGSALRRTVRTFAPWLLTPLRLRVWAEDVTRFFLELVRAAGVERARHVPRRVDFMQLLLQLRERGVIDDDDDDETGDDEKRRRSKASTDARNHVQAEKLELTEEQLAAQVFLFFFAGFETSSSAMSFTLYELALNPEIQTRLREEVVEVLARYNNEVTYESLHEMTFMDQVFEETLRKYPPVANLTRVCRKSYTIPGSNFNLEAGTKIVIPIFAIQRDSLYYPNPDQYDPERFDADEKSKRHPFSYLPFGEGPRVCLGLRFGIMQAKLGLALLISNFSFQVCESTPIPVKLSILTSTTVPEGGIDLRISLASKSNYQK